jgi:hypothetical protein
MYQIIDKQQIAFLLYFSLHPHNLRLPLFCRTLKYLQFYYLYNIKELKAL